MTKKSQCEANWNLHPMDWIYYDFRRCPQGEIVIAYRVLLEGKTHQGMYPKEQLIVVKSGSRYNIHLKRVASEEAFNLRFEFRSPFVKGSSVFLGKERSIKKAVEFIQKWVAF